MGFQEDQVICGKGVRSKLELFCKKEMCKVLQFRPRLMRSVRSRGRFKEQSLWSCRRCVVAEAAQHQFCGFCPLRHTGQPCIVCYCYSFENSCYSLRDTKYASICCSIASTTLEFTDNALLMLQVPFESATGKEIEPLPLN